MTTNRATWIEWGTLTTTLALGLAAATMPACGSSEQSQQHASVGQVSAALQPLTSCQDVENAVRASALRYMNERLDERLETFLQNNGNDCYGMGGAGGGSSADAGAAPPPENTDDGAEETSETNNQVAGVDEADFVKNDNQYIYLVSGGHLRIIDAWPAEQAAEIAKVPLTGTPLSIFVADDKVLVYASDSNAPYSPPCSYGYDCDFVGDGTPTRISVFDITDRTNPILERELELSGSFLGARRIGSAVHTLVHDGADLFPGVSYTPESLNSCQEQPETVIQSAFDELRYQNTQMIATAQISDKLPRVTDIVHAGANAGSNADVMTSCQGYYNSPIGDGTGFLTLLSLDIADTGSLDTSTIFSRPGATYASGEALYISVRHDASASTGWYTDAAGEQQASTVHKFQLISDPPSATYRASGLVEGAVLNQFSMDEYDRHFRIATTSGHVPDPSVHSAVTILSEQGDQLVQIGKLDNIAPTEDIRSVRFDGRRGYIVTFKKTDPLFVLDLATPTNPQILGELKIPGFSTYMHRIDENHLLSIGYDADDQGDFAWFTGVMLQIFDVTNPTDPQLMHKEVIGTRGSSSEALNNHLGFTYFAAKDVLALPMTVCEDSAGGGSYGTSMTFSGLMVFDTTVAEGFELRGQIPFPTDGAGGYDDLGCSNWWTDARSEVRRSIFMDDYVYAISNDLVKVAKLDDLGTEVAAIPVGN
jgi:hypothetical protein